MLEYLETVSLLILFLGTILRNVLEKRKWIQNFLMCCDGGSDFLQIAESMGVYAGELEPIARLLLEQGLIKEKKCLRD